MLDPIKTYHDVISSPEYHALNAVQQIEVIAEIIKSLSSFKTALIKKNLEDNVIAQHKTKGYVSNLANFRKLHSKEIVAQHTQSRTQQTCPSIEYQKAHGIRQVMIPTGTYYLKGGA
jgi:hypothetical protein